MKLPRKSIERNEAYTTRNNRQISENQNQIKSLASIISATENGWNENQSGSPEEENNHGYRRKWRKPEENIENIMQKASEKMATAKKCERNYRKSNLTLWRKNRKAMKWKSANRWLFQSLAKCQPKWKNVNINESGNNEKWKKEMAENRITSRKA